MSATNASSNPIMKLWRQLSTKPGGKWLFSKGVCIKAPYFSTIHPRFLELDDLHAVVQIPDRRSMHNHIGSVHAIALCNTAEIAAGTCCEASMPASMRWIPAGMTVKYLKVAKGTLTAYCKLPEIKLGESQDLIADVEIKDGKGEVVFTAAINMYVSPKKKA